MQAREQRAGVADVPPYGRVGPRAFAIAVKPQVQLDQAGDGLGRGGVEAQRLHPAGDQLGADDLVVMKADPASGLEPAGRRLADIVQQRGQTQHQIGPGHLVVLQGDGLLEHGEGVLVDVLVPVVLVTLEPQRGQLGQHHVGQPGVDQQGQARPWVRGEQYLHQLDPNSFGRDDGEALGHLGHRGRDRRRDGEPELGGEAGGPHHPQRVVRERVLRGARRPQQLCSQVAQPAEGVDQQLLGQHQRHRVHSEVAPPEVTGQRVAEDDVGLARVRVVVLAAVRRDLQDVVPAPSADRPERAAQVPAGVDPTGENRLSLFGPGVGGEVQVGDRTSEHQVAHRPADQRQLMPGRDEALTQGEGHGRHRRLGPGGRQGSRHEASA